MRLRSLLLPVALFACTAAAHATSVTYNLAGYSTPAGQGSPIILTGTATFNLFVPNPSVISITLNFTNSATETGVGSKGYVDGHTFYVGANNDLLSFNDDLHNFTLGDEYFNVEDITGDYVGCAAGPAGTPTAICQITGTMTPVAPTPEPSSFALLGSGLLGVVGLVRRRLS